MKKTDLVLGNGEEAGHGIGGGSERSSEDAGAPGYNATVEGPAGGHGDALAVAGAKGNGVGSGERIEEGLNHFRRVLLRVEQ